MIVVCVLVAEVFVLVQYVVVVVSTGSKKNPQKFNTCIWPPSLGQLYCYLLLLEGIVVVLLLVVEEVMIVVCVVVVVAEVLVLVQYVLVVSVVEHRF